MEGSPPPPILQARGCAGRQEQAGCLCIPKHAGKMKRPPLIVVGGVHRSAELEQRSGGVHRVYRRRQMERGLAVMVTGICRNSCTNQPSDGWSQIEQSGFMQKSLPCGAADPARLGRDPAVVYEGDIIKRNRYGEGSVE